MLGIFKTLKSSAVWNTLQDYWKMYQKKQCNKGNDIQDDGEGGHDKECDKSNKKIGELMSSITLSVMELMTY